ncbi:zinc ribbon domain-containing protein [Methanobacterium spitsbergense]|uniref:DUF3792 family protein n=1 Tax=Methanobacterium spitsbergense TaxID=2874285 RepID=A0A8T5UWI0_9EURY|nr:zinc ribbon domain-containing protein [Methanobacterium spitsbergense]MBZ2166647.1 DUF3792 family protein [Methanobacterium spitsbergense]
MVKCPECGSKNDNGNVYCSECGNNLKILSKTSNFNKKAILLGIIILYFLLTISGNLKFNNLPMILISIILSYFISGFITGYTADRLYTRSSILNGLVVGIIITIPMSILVSELASDYDPEFTYYSFIFLLLMIFLCGLGGGLGGYIKLKKNLGKSKEVMI